MTNDLHETKICRSYTPTEKDLNAHVRMAKIAPGTVSLSIVLSLVYCGDKIADLNEEI
jgi:hypothetical protein